MVAISGPELNRRAELLVLVITAVAALLAAVVPVYYVVLLPLACASMALVAPAGRRTASAMAVWFPVSAGLLVGTALV